MSVREITHGPYALCPSPGRDPRHPATAHQRPLQTTPRHGLACLTDLRSAEAAVHCRLRRLFCRRQSLKTIELHVFWNIGSFYWTRGFNQQGGIITRNIPSKDSIFNQKIWTEHSSSWGFFYDAMLPPCGQVVLLRGGKSSATTAIVRGVVVVVVLVVSGWTHPDNICD